ncbi:MAG: HTH domain-containing protein [Spirochaetaceae bacterium]|nr:HTH domain-containing protein [Spirochaetaceae bacterium]
MSIRDRLSVFSPRIVRLLDLLIRQDEPVSVDSMAAALESSRRTVFRDLEAIERSLDQVRLVSVPGRGIRIECDEGVRRELAALLDKEPLQPVNRRLRIRRLMLEVLANSGSVQKLFFYSDSLGVSESTVSNDLDAIDPLLKEYAITLVRRPGQGVYAEGAEEDIRAAIREALMREGQSCLSYTRNTGYPGNDIEEGVAEALERHSLEFDWMTAESLQMFAVYLMVMIRRVADGALLQEGPSSAGSFQDRLAERLIRTLEERFAVTLPPEEHNGVALCIQACRSKQDSPLQVETSEERERISALTVRIIERFDPALAPVLLTNEMLVQGINRHLLSALTRLGRKLVLPDFLDGQLESQYPEIYEKSRRGAEALSEYMGRSVPPGEVSLIAIHFLAALSAMDEKNIRRRVLTAGVVCAAGIGMAYMLASQVRKRFKGELEIDICGWNDQWEKTDFLISTIPLENAGRPVILVHALLTEEDYQKIGEIITARAFVGKNVPVQNRKPLTARLERVIAVLGQVFVALSVFRVERVPADCAFEDLARAAAAFVEDEAGARIVYRDLLDREAVVSQIIEEMKIVLLHAKSAGAAAPVFGLITPEGGVFLNKYFRGAQSCLLMLIPHDCTPDLTGIMGTISSALIDTPALPEAVRAGDGPAVKALMEGELAEALTQYCAGKLNG